MYVCIHNCGGRHYEPSHIGLAGVFIPGGGDVKLSDITALDFILLELLKWLLLKKILGKNLSFRVDVKQYSHNMSDVRN